MSTDEKLRCVPITRQRLFGFSIQFCDVENNCSIYYQARMLEVSAMCDELSAESDALELENMRLRCVIIYDQLLSPQVLIAALHILFKHRCLLTR